MTNSAPPVAPIGGGDPSAVCLNNRLANRQPQAHASSPIRRNRRAAKELVEDLLFAARRQTGAIVGDANLRVRRRWHAAEISISLPAGV